MEHLPRGLVGRNLLALNIGGGCNQRLAVCERKKQRLFTALRFHSTALQ